MHVAQRPVVVSLRHKFPQTAGGVVGVIAHAPEGGVEHPDVEGVRHRCRIAGNQVHGHGLLAKTLAVQGDIQLVEPKRLRLS